MQVLRIFRASSKKLIPSVAAAVLALVLVLDQPTAQAAGESVTLSTFLAAEGNDFATARLRDPWDMDEYSDVSMYINESNVAIHLQNIQTSGGMFSAQSVGNDAQFHTLFPGYQSSIPAGKTGARHPITTSRFHCLFIRMQVLSSDTFDEVRVLWFEDNRLTGSTFGSGRLSDFPFASGWQFFAVDLNAVEGLSGAAWSDQLEWQGLRIDPTINGGIDFSVDWIRLTDCAQDPVTVSWSGIVGAVEIWAGIGAQQPDFQVPPGPLSLPSCTSNSCVIDLQGWQPGSYYIGVKRLSDGQIFWTTQPLVIDPAPIIRIARPSFTSGQSIFWPMNELGEIVTAYTVCVGYFFDSGLLDLTTLPPGQLPGNCVSGGNSDPQVVLSQSEDVDTSLFRYLVFETSMEGAWQDVNLGWIIRWIWSPYPNCFQVSNDIPFDVGWQELSLDLHDPTEGLAEDSAGAPGVTCPIRHWQDFPATYLRFDPNENRTTESFHQQVDQITLSAMDRAAAGSKFPIQLDSSEDVGGLSLSFFYTTDADADPTQNAIVLVGAPPPPPGPFNIFLPAILNDAVGGNAARPTFLWDTVGVASGVYYVCLEAADGQNSAVYCSDAPVEVY